MSSGPVCHIPPANTPADPQAKSIPGVPGPINPGSPTFNQDVAALLNALRLLMLALSGQLPNQQQGNGTGFSNSAVSNGSRSQQSQPSRWEEDGRTTEKVRIYQNNDPTSENYVDVEQINSLRFRDKVTKELWSWDRNRK